ncbi:uncharacterized protein I206_105691 [Kwoniella pini CBS 10737]|uniref:CLASP N-terminal domain-containing protein n=1 Tax=Kwoniella pini CBS 10737 TaxID=1296096 RepID=A0A1B9I3I4_9TREE|nr:uncharacterized protein I206_03406 [Kwoniella pini CBS 10737]OCF50089.1 hypothetical protein I206_03406 [Kwoniella pini CBS 10737]
MAPTLAADAKIPCPTPQHLREELDNLAWALEPEEKEDTWEKFERAIIRFAAVTRGGGYKHTEQYVEGVGRSGVGKKLVKCMLSDRGRLSGVSTDLLQTFAPRLSTNFKPLVNLYLEPVLALLGRPNKVFLKRAEKCLLTILTHCQLITILPELRRGLNDNATTCRRGSAIGIERAVNEWPGELWTEKYLSLLEESVKKMAVDKDPEVRQTSRRVWAIFVDLWPERVENFSAPLTPTIKRYLGLPAANGAGPSKPKPKAPIRAAPAPVLAPAPPTRPNSVASSELPHDSAPIQPSAASRPQHHRVNALAARPLRPIYHAPPPTVEAGPSRRQSPRKEVDLLPAATEENLPDTHLAQPSLHRSASSSNQLHQDLIPPFFGRQGRSVSHNVLSSTNLPSEENKQNPLSKPSRPALHPSLSAPPEGFDTAPPRKFAPPARIMRIIPSEEEGGLGLGDHPNALRGPQRNHNAGLGKRTNALGGQAHRRVVTAPSMPEEGYFAKTPGGAQGRSRERTDAVEYGEDQRNITAHAPKSFGSPLPKQIISMDSPLMPTLIRSASGEVRSDENESDIIDMKAHTDVYPASPIKVSIEANEERKVVEVARKIELPESPVKTAVNLPEDIPEEKVEIITEDDDETVEDDITDNASVRSLSAALDIDGHKDVEEGSDIAMKGEPAFVAEEMVEKAEDHSPPSNAPETTDATLNKVDDVASAADIAKTHKTLTSVNEVNETVKSAQLTANNTRPVPAASKTRIAGTVTRKPPVPTARTTARAVSAPVLRKAFKPTSLSAPTAASAARVAAISKPASATTAVSKPLVATSTTSKAPSASTTSASNTTKPTLNGSTSSKPSTAPVRARVVSAQIVKHEPKITTKPPIPPNQPLPKAATRVVSGPKTMRPPTAHVTLPPVKKEKVVRKAPLPSFRPTRGATSGTASLKASTSSVVSVGTAGGRAKVKPENIKLPESPFKTPTEVPLPPSPHEIPLPHSPHPRAPSVMSSISNNNPAVGSPLKVEMGGRARVHKDSIINLHIPPQSPMKTLSPAKTLSPLLTSTNSEEILPPQPVFSIPAESLVKQTKAKFDTTDLFSASRPATPNSKSSNGTTTTEILNASSSSNDDISDDKITFKSLSPSRPISFRQENNKNIAHGNRSDVSTPLSKASALLAKLEGSEKGISMIGMTPERKALSVKDANTPHGFGAAEDWDVSA